MAEAPGYDGQSPLQNARHELFCNLYIFGTADEDEEVAFNATECYLRSGYSCRTRRHASRHGSRLMSRDDVQARILHLRQELKRQADLGIRPWRTLVPQAQRVIIEAARNPEEGDSIRLRAAKELLRQAYPPPRIRFRRPTPQKADEDAPAHPAILVLGGVAVEELEPPDDLGEEEDE